MNVEFGDKIIKLAGSTVTRGYFICKAGVNEHGEELISVMPTDNYDKATGRQPVCDPAVRWRLYDKYNVDASSYGITAQLREIARCWENVSEKWAELEPVLLDEPKPEETTEEVTA